MIKQVEDMPTEGRFVAICNIFGIICSGDFKYIDGVLLSRVNGMWEVEDDFMEGAKFYVSEQSGIES